MMCQPTTGNRGMDPLDYEFSFMDWCCKLENIRVFSSESLQKKIQEIQLLHICTARWVDQVIRHILVRSSNCTSRMVTKERIRKNEMTHN